MTMMDAVLLKYIEKYAEPEVQQLNLSGRYESAVVVPAHAESDEFVSILVKQQVPRDPGLRRLLILVVNERADASVEASAANRRLLESCAERATLSQNLGLPHLTLHRLKDTSGLDILSVDMCGRSFRLRAKEGVGRARKLGADIALLLYSKGLLKSRFLGSTDCDARLPVDYFETLERCSFEADASALLFPYAHTEPAHAQTHALMCEVEASFRHYVLGLAQAGSPYAYHSLGSALAVSLPHYARVRGFPNRQAGEDFHLLSKLAKLAPLRRLHRPRVVIETRVSHRAPFGTGPSLGRALEQEASGERPRLFYDDGAFQSLKALLSVLVEAAEQQHLEEARLAELGEVERSEAFRIWSELQKHLTHCPSGSHRVARLHESFDALATLRFIHQLHRSRGFKKRTLSETVQTEFGNFAPPDAEHYLDQLKQREESLPEFMGPKATA
jgi:hypothetical protein